MERVLRAAFSRVDAVMNLDRDSQFVGRKLPMGVNAQLAPGLEGADKDLALRIRDSHEPSAPWFVIDIEAVESDGLERNRRPSGELRPLLVDDLGDALAAVWLPDEGDERWYVFPCGSDWESILGWLVDHGVPEYVPQAAARVRSLGIVGYEFLTNSEREAMEALQGFERRTVAERANLVARIEEAKGAAEHERDALLYGGGDTLKEVVAAVLGSCGFEVEDLDVSFGSGQSGDLLASFEGRHWMVEVRAVGGSPSEKSVYDVVKHLATWRKLGRSEEIETGVLALNHNHKEAPAARARVPYRREEFVDSFESLNVTVISTVRLCEWWAQGDLDTIRAAVTGPPAQYPSAQE
jgi:hypothetical protein